MDFESEKVAADLLDVKARHKDNRTAWDEGARSYTDRKEDSVEQLRQEHSNLHPVERSNLERFGPLAHCR